jgi:hypothetical protein
MEEATAAATGEVAMEEAAMVAAKVAAAMGEVVKEEAMEVGTVAARVAVVKAEETAATL